MQITTQTQLAETIGVSRQAVAKLLKHHDCPIGSTGPWQAADVRKFIEWHGTLQEDRSKPSSSQMPDGMTPGRAVEIRLKMERMKKVKLEREILERLYVARDEVEKGWTERATYFRASLENLPTTVAARLVGLEASEIEAELRTQIDAILDGYARKPWPGVSA